MSDQGDSAGTPGGGPPAPGWWQASDGNWYPPESAPGASPPPGPEPGSTPPGPAATPPGGPPPGTLAGGPPPPGGPPPGGAAPGSPPPYTGPPAPSSSSGGAKVLIVIGGVVVGVIVLSIIAIAAITFLGESEPERDETGAITEEGDLGVFGLRPGDCFDDPPGIITEDTEVESVDAIPCDQPHDNEVFHVFELPSGPFPGDATLNEEAAEVCIPEFEAYTGQDYFESDLDIFPITPTEQTWELGDERTVVCALYDLDLNKLTGSQQAG